MPITECIDKVADVSGMLDANPRLLIKLASITQPRVFILTPFYDDDGRRRCQVIGKGSHSVNDDLTCMSQEKLEILRAELDYSAMGPCVPKFLQPEDCTGYLRCAELFTEWGADKGVAVQQQVAELCTTLTDCAEYQQNCDADAGILSFHWDMKTLHRKQEYGGGVS